MMDEVFGSDNFCKIIPFQKTSGQESKILASTLDYLIWYAKDIETIKFRQLFQQREAGEKSLDRYDMVLLNNTSMRRLTTQEITGNIIPKGARRYQLSALFSEGASQGPQEFEFEGKSYNPRSDTHWKTTVDGLGRLCKAERIEKMGSVLRYRRFSDDFPVIPFSDRWDSVQLGTEKTYVVETSSKVIERCMLMTTDPGDLVLDPTCGSGTTAYVAEQWGRRWITLDTSRVSIALARTRLMAGRFPYYFLVDSEEYLRDNIIGMKDLAYGNVQYKAAGMVPVIQVKTNAKINAGNDIRKGFVYKRVPHVTLKSIANNKEIDVVHTKWQPQQDVVRTKLNKLLKKNFEEWELPRQPEDKWLQSAKDLLEEFWKLRQQRQAEIDKSIASHADYELLYDQPYTDPKKVRVTGPFTVESLSPHRVIATDEELPSTQSDNATGRSGGQFEAMILENLKVSGVKTTKKGEGIKFSNLDSYAGQWLHAAGEFTDKDGKTKRVAVCIGPENGTVGPTLVKEAAKEAVQGVGFDVLVVCGFAFDPHVSEEATRYGKLNVMVARMNPDLAMGEELLKKTGAGNLFMVFGEPDVTVKKSGNDVTVSIKGVDVYDPTTGEIRNNSTDDIACWFIDTNYNGESFFVRHAYFCGGNEPYDKLKRALRAEINESAWEAIYSTTSRPFPKPQTGKIAIKVISHYGDEVLKVEKI